METKFPFVNVPPELWPVVGKPDGDSLVYRREGTQEEVGPWYEALTELAGDMVSPGGVGMFCPVSRAAIHKRCREGRLSMFLFHVTSQKHRLFGKAVTHRDSPYAFIPVSEAKAWKAELEGRAVALGIITREELEGSKPDWHGDFLDWQSRWRKEQLEKGEAPK